MGSHASEVTWSLQLLNTQENKIVCISEYPSVRRIIPKNPKWIYSLLCRGQSLELPTPLLLASQLFCRTVMSHVELGSDTGWYWGCSPWWNGSDFIFSNILFPLFKQHHKEIEEQAAMAQKTVMEKLGLCFKKEKNDKGERITKSLFKKIESTDKKEA